MNGLAWRSVRARRTTMTACALSAFLGVAVIVSFTSLLDTAAGTGVSADDRASLVTMASVVGGWGLVIVLFSIASTVGVVVAQRAAELSMLRTLGATPRQVRGLVRRETALVTIVAGAAGLVPGWIGGILLEHLVERGGLIDASVDHRFSPVTAAGVLAGVVAVSLVASGLAARSTTRGAPRSALTAAAMESDRMGRARTAAGLVLLVLGAGSSSATFVMQGSDDPYAAMQTAGPACIAWAMGLGLLSPLVLRRVAQVLEPVVGRGLPGELALAHARRRAVRLSRTLVPLVVFVGIATGTAYLVAIDSHVMGDDVDRTVQLLNVVVVGMIATFAAIMVVNTIVASTLDRRRELARHRVLGATGSDVVSTLVVESVLLLGVALVLGGLASLGTILPYSIVKADSVVPVGGPWPVVLVVAAATLVGVGTTWRCARREMRLPALEAAA